MIKKIFLTVFVCFFFCLTASAENYYIKNYNVDLKVENTKIVHITETIDTYFTRKSHGIIRDIPAPNAEITNIKVSEKNKVSQSGDNYSIRIGHPDKYIKGDHTYKISYDYNFFDNKNEFYFNIIGTDWYTKIDHVNFNVEMPKSFDGEKAGLSIGKYGTRGFSEGEGKFTVKDKNIIGETLRTLQPREGVTIRIEVPNGYFVKNLASKQNVSLYLLIFCTLACIIIWFMYGKDEKPVPVVNFYPPKDKSVLDVELIYNECVSKKGVVATIVDLAQKGYLIIKDDENGFVLEKGKEYDGADKYEKTLINAVFTGDSKTATEKQLRKSSTFYSTSEKIVNEKNKEIDNLYEPEEANKSARKVMEYIILLLGLVLAFVCSSFNLWFIWKGLLIAVALIFAQWFLPFCVCEIKNKNIAIILVNIIVLFPAYIACLAGAEVMDYVYPFGILSFVCLFIASFCYNHLQKLSKPTLMMLGELEGFKKFIQTAELDKLQSLVNENPQYFYNILPYTYIFNLSNKWIKKFENIVQPNTEFNNGYLYKETEFIKFTKTMNKLTEPSYANGGMTSSSGGSSYSSSGGGGGYSGGGGGGGGGRSW